MFTLSSFKRNRDSLIAAAAGFFIIILFTRHSGIGVNPDSITYTTAAKNLYTNGRLYDFMQRPIVEFPAFYPIFLSAVIATTRLDPLVFTPVLNALLFALVIYLSGYISEKFLSRSKWYKTALLTYIVLSPALLEVYSMLWSETLFIVLLLLFIITIYFYLITHSRKSLMAAAVIAALASVTRYAGITVIATGAVLILLDRQLPVRKKAPHLLIYAATGFSLLIINLIRNYITDSSLSGKREKSFTSIWLNLQQAGRVLYNWLPFLNGFDKGAALFTVILIAFLFLLITKKFLKNGSLAELEDIAAVFSLLYILFIVGMATTTRFQPLDSRFLSPVFIPLLLVCSSRMTKPIQESKNIKRASLVLALVVFTLFQYGQLAADYETWDGVKDAGIPGYTEDQWRFSETVLFIQRNMLFKKGHTIYSNANDAVYFFTGKAGRFLPHKEFPGDVQEFLSNPACYVVWFNDGDNPDLVNRNFITNTKKMKLLKQLSDGYIYVTDSAK